MIPPAISSTLLNSKLTLFKLRIPVVAIIGYSIPILTLIALRTAKTLQSFGRSECNRVEVNYHTCSFSRKATLPHSFLTSFSVGVQSLKEFVPMRRNSCRIIWESDTITLLTAVSLTHYYIENDQHSASEIIIPP